MTTRGSTPAVIRPCKCGIKGSDLNSQLYSQLPLIKPRQEILLIICAAIILTSKILSYETDIPTKIKKDGG